MAELFEPQGNCNFNNNNNKIMAPLTCQAVLKAARAGMQDLPSPLQVGSLAGGEHLGRQGRCTLGGGQHCGEDIDCGEKAGEDGREGEPRWGCTLWGE